MNNVKCKFPHAIQNNLKTLNMKSILNPVLKVAIEKKKATPSQNATLSGTAAKRGIGWIFGIKSIKICKKSCFDTNSNPNLTHP